MAAPASAQQAVAGQASVGQSGADEAQFACDLAGDCDPATGAAVSDPAAPAATPGRPAPRGSATRGFSFRRGQADGATPGQSASVAAPAAAPARPVRVGGADLGLTFLPASAVLTDASKARLDKYAAALQLPKLSGRRMRIEGHTDASGSPRANQELSQRRAQAVADYLVQAGVDRQRLDVAGYGASKPLPGVTPQATANRRVMAVLL
ncbi:OmpA family protein [Sphingomonas solaris]|uniref:OmpA family protein n=2 Tax=Alterirhizorhabdus solaris TaxID=2529389 RepID=A0A558QZH2_9SPHN|nr:OmpA family protein [Sphingomonas solaris]